MIEYEDIVVLELNNGDEKISYKSENFFYALKNLREELESRNIQIICNGTAKNIYPSTMQMSMGSGRVAYKLFIGEPAKNSDVVDIFDCDEELEFVSVAKQYKYYVDWLKSILG